MTAVWARQRTVSYFGKLPSEGDFLKCTGDGALFARLDAWVGDGIEQLRRSADWKLSYDRAAPVNFAWAGSRSRSVVTGHLIPSQDASERRYPFWCAAPFDVDEPARFLSRLPLAVSQAWDSLGTEAARARAGTDARAALQRLSATALAPHDDAPKLDAAFQRFLQVESLGSLDALLEHSGHAQASTARLLIALGLLLEAVPQRGCAGIARGLSIPLPIRGANQSLVATLWMDAIAPFLAAEDVAISILLPAGHAPWLILGFGPDRSAALLSALDPRESERLNVRLANLDWVDDAIDDERRLQGLARLLAQPELSLLYALERFRRTFSWRQQK